MRSQDIAEDSCIKVAYLEQINTLSQVIEIDH